MIVVLAMLAAGCGDDEPTAAGPWGYGDHETLDGLWDDCADGVWQACDALYTLAMPGSDYEAFGATCGERTEGGNWCTLTLSSPEEVCAIVGCGPDSQGYLDPAALTPEAVEITGLLDVSYAARMQAARAGEGSEGYLDVSDLELRENNAWDVFQVMPIAAEVALGGLLSLVPVQLNPFVTTSTDPDIDWSWLDCMQDGEYVEGCLDGPADLQPPPAVVEPCPEAGPEDDECSVRATTTTVAPTTTTSTGCNEELDAGQPGSCEQLPSPTTTESLRIDCSNPKNQFELDECLG